MTYYEGTIEIPAEEFWEFVSKYCPAQTAGHEVTYGKPRMEKNGIDLRISFAASSDGNPVDWSVKPTAITEWDEK